MTKAWERLRSAWRLSLSATPPSLKIAQADEARMLAALLVWAARADGEYQEIEREAIASMLARRYGLDGRRAQELLALAERDAGEAVEMQRFTRALKDEVPLEERGAIVEMLFETAFADGVLDPYEDQVIRRISGLLYVDDRSRGEIRSRVRARVMNEG